MNTTYFIKFIEHSPEFYELISKRPTAFCLLTILVDRARKAEIELKDDLSIGDVYTGAGDAEKYKATRQIYRTDLAFLRKTGQILIIKTTSKGTTVRIVNSSIFDISRTRTTSEETIEQLGNNQQLSTKQEDITKKKDLVGLGLTNRRGTKSDLGTRPNLYQPYKKFIKKGGLANGKGII